MTKITHKHHSDASFILSFPDLLEDYQWLAGEVKSREIGAALSDDEVRELSIARRIIDAQTRAALRQGSYQQLPEDHRAVPFVMRAFGALLAHDFHRAQMLFTRAVIEVEAFTQPLDPKDSDVVVWEIDARDLAKRQEAQRAASKQAPRAA
jgi:hypothetical protein